MVERPADILPMSGAQAQPLAWHARADAALRRTKGLGMFITFVVLDRLYDTRSWILLALFVLAVAASLAEEFIKLPGERGFIEHRES